MTKTAIITGAGRGIGEGIAYRLAENDYAIAVADINFVSAKKVAENLKQQGALAKAYQLDVANRNEVFDLVSEVIKEFGELAIFVNNAGVAFIDSFVDSNPSDVERLLDVNLKGTYWGIQAAAKQFQKQGRGGRIINAASLAGVEASALQSAYSASKFAIRGLTQAAAKELAKYKITVNAYDPGVVRTPLRDAIDQKTAAIKGLSVEKQKESVLKEIALGREATPKDVAEVVSWLSSPSANYITGQSILVDGGMRYQ
ncbi:Diacetyl reductase [(S)-acetoin forming] [Oenococcus oeni]|uniref:acetoin reductase n=1 Tax=Oenococcus oeni TaxID=1247 RepID=UPI00107837C3|nr:acetoin reductase [Oenococcus oeni]AVI94243.1 acetoin reductase [Oenococcus oeni]SYW00106.1 Diacetyl reductase ((S)-acetoin forming) [Oenococcus oeni]SYW04395.1 Diacetyl reductase ((S)-acetoin forming) [Oenococcus oeni]SYW17482.1 Diacetyl reductase ((S)-acetoin forming) [Oenococcus oeni]VDC14794.1 Diacetyl reductase [(S)-acetoin forming] [Oenococcus oeni]